ncbi:MAG: hypothetical protein U9N81_10515 [Bacillota bacterium]|nr:hypothetical protein [Bacillota bacterium]
MAVNGMYVGAAVAALEAAGITTFFIEADTRRVYLIGLQKLLEYLGVNNLTGQSDEVVYHNWCLIEGIPSEKNIILGSDKTVVHKVQYHNNRFQVEGW